MSLDIGMQALENILKSPGNNCCYDCGESDCSWASVTIGCFLCIRCSGIHRQLGVHISRVRSVQLDNWTLDDCVNLKKYGNRRLPDIYEVNKPEVYKKPDSRSHSMLIEHWIRAKYEWKEFHVDCTQLPFYVKGVKSGTLYKKGKERGCWLARHFMLDRTNRKIIYYDKANTQGQKQLGLIPLDGCFVLMVDEKLVDRQNCLHILYRSGRAMRSIYVAGTTVRETVEWFYAIRSLQTQLGYSGNCVDTVFESYLEKTPKDGKGQWRKRWCILVADRIFYYKNILDPFPKGEVKLSKTDTVEKLHCIPKHVKSGADYIFTLTTSNRTYYWGTPSEELCTTWIQKIDRVIKDLYV